ncbi:GTPase [Alienimonas chondri]|uniref:GTPase n=1 Tax=Alienimonas chondri TaxID=2681879 RepID=UPI00148898A1|nr:GTPase [Alienimonas chondri]
MAVIRLIGPPTLCDAAFAAANGRPASAQPLDRTAFGLWGSKPDENRPGEELIVVRTAEGETEIHCHGGLAAVEGVFADLTAAGATRVSWEEQERDRAGILQAELSAALAAAPTVRCAGIILDQASGTLAEGLSDPSQHAAMRERIEFGRHLTQPWLVVIAGPPNAGKSSLLNAIAGYSRAIVSPTAGTTRDAVGVTVAIEGWPVRLTDTAGLRETLDPLEAAGVAKARETLAEADAVIQVADGTDPGDLDAVLPHPRRLRVWNKIDLSTAGPVPAGWRGVSAETGEGLKELSAALSRLLVPAPPPPGTPVPLTNRQASMIGG